MGEWFTDWFNSSYYHLLYTHRNEEEASHFIQQLVTHLKIKPGSLITDVGCGSGRHCRALLNFDMQVTGLDLSYNSIKNAKEKSSAHIAYYEHDMRKALPVQNQDVVLSLFTSFGYFDSPDESLSVLKNIHTSLKNNGILLLDYLNAVPLYNMPEQTTNSNCGGVEFSITKHSTQSHIFKTISINDQGKKCSHTEKVALYSLPHLSTFLHQTGFQIIGTFGDYMFNTYQPHSSPRLIIHAAKK
ncbi:MAG: class I SAM-dependent methyltransferase [Flavobacteriales bacterium]